ncbi:MAG: glycosyltransferase, partial [Coriobacteriia bacterium]|nr:glycosyltransferase [Coriobacteriia bacterium]
ESLLAEIPASVSVLRAWSLEPTRLVAFLRKVRNRVARDARAAELSGTRGYTSMPGWFIRFVQSFFIPDEKLGWTPYAMRLARAAHRNKPFDVILASGPPFTALSVARRLASRLRLPWVADLRDPIVGGYFFRPLTPLHDRLMLRFESRVVGSAASVVTTSDGFTASLCSRYPEARTRLHTITNGFDPEDFEGATAAPHPGFVLSYVGTFQGSVSPDGLLDALVQLRQRRSSVLSDLRVRFVGALDDETGRAISERGLEDVVERVGYVPHREAVAEMCAASVLFEVRGPEPESSGMIPGKLLEYLASRRPVLAVLSSGSTAAEILKRAGAAEVIEPGDIAGIAAALERLHAAWSGDELPEPDSEVVAEFDRSRLVARYATLLGQVIADAR